MKTQLETQLVRVQRMSEESSVSKGTSVSRTPSKAQDPWQERGQKDGKSQRLERTRAKP